MADSQLSQFIKIYIDVLCTLGRPRNCDFSRCDYRAAQMKHTVVYACARTDEHLIVAIKKLQRVPVLGRHNCRLTTACTSEIHRNKWARANGRLSPPFLCAKPLSCGSVILTKRICFRYGVQWGIRLWNNISETERRPALNGCSLL
jgi:hypothetical protein